MCAICRRRWTRCATIKSAAEIALIRQATRLAGLGIMEAMRSTSPGVYEYQLDAAAKYVFYRERRARRRLRLDYRRRYERLPGALLPQDRTCCATATWC